MAQGTMERNNWHEAKLTREGNPSIYAIEFRSETIVGEDSKIRKCEVGAKSSIHITEKVIMFVGETGTGKTTMINRIVNYLLGVQWEDKERYKLIGDEEEESGEGTSQTESKTKWISAYTIHQTKAANCKVTLIDTPGFGDTGGKERDKYITSQIRTFFCTKGEGGIDHIDAVAFVLVASARRLTETQRYIFDSVLHLFGKDISDNIFLFITHAETENIEDGDAPVIEAVKDAHVPFANFHIFNNASLFRDKHKVSGRRAASSSSRNKETWDFGGEDLDNFFGRLDECEPKSIFLSAEVLAERASLEIIIKALPAYITTCLVEVKKLQEEEQVLEKYKKEMEQNVDFQYSVNEEVQINTRLHGGRKATVCMKCIRTCHYPCRGNSPALCGIFGSITSVLFFSSKGSCLVCPGHCQKRDHRTVPYMFESKIRTVIKTLEDVKQQYDLAKEGIHKSKIVMSKINEKLSSAQKTLETCVVTLRRCLLRLDEIALKSDALPVSDYIVFLIESERQNGKPGWEDRVKELEKLYERERAEEIPGQQLNSQVRLPVYEKILYRK